jgi:hypothetical protein
MIMFYTPVAKQNRCFAQTDGIFFFKYLISAVEKYFFLF